MTSTTRDATLSIEEAAKTLGIGRTLAYALARQGKFPGLLRIGDRRLRVSRTALERYLEEAKR